MTFGSSFNSKIPVCHLPPKADMITAVEAAITETMTRIKSLSMATILSSKENK